MRDFGHLHVDRRHRHDLPMCWRHVHHNLGASDRHQLHGQFRLRGRQLPALVHPGVADAPVVAVPDLHLRFRQLLPARVDVGNRHQYVLAAARGQSVRLLTAAWRLFGGRGGAHPSVPGGLVLHGRVGQLDR